VFSVSSEKLQDLFLDNSILS